MIMDVNLNKDACYTPAALATLEDLEKGGSLREGREMGANIR
jgi:hypothetical protein